MTTEQTQTPETATKSPKPIKLRRTVATSFAPRNFAEALQFCKVIAETDCVPKDFRGKPGNVLAAIQLGAEVGLGPMRALESIMVVNGRASIWGDTMLALVRASGLLEYIRESDDGQKAICQVKRKGEAQVEKTFSNDDARRARLLAKPGPWQDYPARMRQMRARGFALRDVFPDVLKGFISREEAMDYPSDMEAIPTTASALGEEVTRKLAENLLKVAEGNKSPEVRDESEADRVSQLRMADSSPVRMAEPSKQAEEKDAQDDSGTQALKAGYGSPQTRPPPASAKPPLAGEGPQASLGVRGVGKKAPAPVRDEDRFLTPEEAATTLNAVDAVGMSKQTFDMLLWAKFGIRTIDRLRKAQARELTAMLHEFAKGGE